MASPAPRYFRCTSDACRRKWHHSSMGVMPAKPTNLFEAITTRAPGEGCPACGAPCEPEHGSFQELFGATG